MGKTYKSFLPLTHVQGGPAIADEELPDYYKILNIDNTVTFKDVKVAYKRLADKYHPDKMSHLSEEDQADYQEKMKLLNEAKDTLADPVRRSKYDQKLGIDIYKDLRKLKTFKTDASVSRVSQSGENFFQNGYNGYGYDRDGAGYGAPNNQGYNPNYYNNNDGYNQYSSQTQYATQDDRYYHTGQRYQPNQIEKQTYLCPYCNKKFRMAPPKDIMITSCPTCRNDITIYPE